MSRIADVNVALRVSELTVQISSGDEIVEDVDLQLARGEILGLVGESGSGKTTTALSLLGYTSEGTQVRSGELRLGDQVVRMDDSMRMMRGVAISYVPQDPSRSLNPSRRIGDAIGDVVRAHGRNRRELNVISRILEAVGLPGSAEFARRYPHQLSGGQQQRVLIAMALVCEPRVIVLDEPTTGLDVITQAKIVSLLMRLRDEHGISMVYVTHDLAVIAQMADRIAVMYAGRIVEQGPAELVLRRPRHPYTRGLLMSIPDHARPRVIQSMAGIAVGVGEHPSGCSFASRCPQRTEACAEQMPAIASIGEGRDVRCLHWADTPAIDLIPLDRPTETPAASEPALEVRELTAEHRAAGATVIAASDIGFRVERGTCVALVGESGSGKTTIARAIAGLHPIAAGTIVLAGEEVPSLARRRTREQRRRIQLVFQSAAEALNPRHRVREAIGRPAQVLRGLDHRGAAAEVTRLLAAVRLPARTAERYPGELSGGERQRVALARALAADPEIILCDEITSALDVSVQAAVLEVLADLRRDLGLSLLFITHDLGVVATIADQVLVLENGVICERGAAGTVLTAPQHPYTQRLLDSAPSVIETIGHWESRVESPTHLG